MRYTQLSSSVSLLFIIAFASVSVYSMNVTSDILYMYILLKLQNYNHSNYHPGDF